jgi:hypothetical protein
MLDNPDPVAPAVSIKLAVASPPRSFFAAGHAMQWRHEQYACAQIGLTPGTASFTDCVAGLNAALMPNPS